MNKKNEISAVLKKHIASLLEEYQEKLSKFTPKERAQLIHCFTTVLGEHIDYLTHLLGSQKYNELCGNSPIKTPYYILDLWMNNEDTKHLKHSLKEFYDAYLNVEGKLK